MKVCMAPFHGRSKVYKFAAHNDGINAVLTLHMEGSHADKQFQGQKIAEIAISAKKTKI